MFAKAVLRAEAKGGGPEWLSPGFVEELSVRPGISAVASGTVAAWLMAYARANAGARCASRKRCAAWRVRTEEGRRGWRRCVRHATRLSLASPSSLPSSLMARWQVCRGVRPVPVGPRRGTRGLSLRPSAPFRGAFHARRLYRSSSTSSSDVLGLAPLCSQYPLASLLVWGSCLWSSKDFEQQRC